MKPGTIEEYLSTVPDDKRVALEKLRRAIISAAPGAEECIAYQVPSFRVDGKVLLAMAAMKHHCAFYVMSPAVVEALADDLRGFDTGKGTVRFSPNKPLPAALVTKLVKARIAETTKAKGSE